MICCQQGYTPNLMLAGQRICVVSAKIGKTDTQDLLELKFKTDNLMLFVLCYVTQQPYMKCPMWGKQNDNLLFSDKLK